jgi:hypothetical protein
MAGAGGPSLKKSVNITLFYIKYVIFKKKDGRQRAIIFLLLLLRYAVINKE